MRHEPARSLLITDLDNTLWDWFGAWHASFSAMLDRLTSASGVPREQLEAEIRVVHQARGTPEYSHLLNEVPSLVAAASPKTALEVFDDAVHALHSTRRRLTVLYPGVRETLTTLRGMGVTIAAYTESVAYWTEWRIKHTGLDGVIDVLYSAPDHELPDGVTVQQLRRRADTEYGLGATEHRFVPRGVTKPNATILRSILRDCGKGATQTVYVGDSLMKDIAMAQAVGVLDVHAEYGLVQSEPEYDLLRRVTHWTDTDVERERQLSTNGEVSASVTLRHSLCEVLPLFDVQE